MTCIWDKILLYYYMSMDNSNVRAMFTFYECGGSIIQKVNSQVQVLLWQTGSCFASFNIYINKLPHLIW